MFRLLSLICLVAGFASILGSIAIWSLTKEPDTAHGERFGIFIGLWAPTFFILSERLNHWALSLNSSPTNRSSEPAQQGMVSISEL
jgi:hypothetical protein